jgi:hypothetical protein
MANATETNDLIVLHSDRLRLEIAPPGHSYTGSRWNWNGFVLQATLDGRDTFCTSESLTPGGGMGGEGLCSEYGIFAPIGFEDARAGECFPKPGIGLLKKPDGEAYAFSHAYEITPFPRRIDVEESTAVFECEPLPCRGYEFRTRERLWVAGNRFGVDYEFENVGAKTIQTHEYRHNFLSINGSAPGPDVRLALGVGLQIHDAPGSVQVLAGGAGCEVRWRGAVEKGFLCHAVLPPGKHEDSEREVWKLQHEASGAWISESVQGAFANLNLWCEKHVLSPEAFVAIDVAPGQVQKWRRVYEFAGARA